jgi:membrane fusion protein (multidrug efflux system)
MRHLRLPVALLAPFVWFGCGAAAGPGGPPPPPEVVVVEVQPQSVPLTLSAPGRVEGSRELEVRARVRGIVLERTHQEGQAVRRGELLFRLDDAEYVARVTAAEARLAEAVARREQAEREQARLAPLVATRAASQKSLDDASSTAALAAAAVLGAQAALDQAELELSWTRIAAPGPGIVRRALVSEGALVEPGDRGLLTHIVQVDPAWVRFGLSATDFARLRRAAGERPVLGLGVAVEESTGGRTLGQGVLDFVDAGIDAATGTIALRATVANADRRLIPGEFVTVKVLDLAHTSGVVLPQRAVQQGREGHYVFVVEGETAVLRPVEVGEWSGTEWIIESGLVAGDRVVVDGVQRVRPDAPVRVAAAEPAS